jgi:uncharacterized protein (DUF488 family)
MARAKPTNTTVIYTIGHSTRTDEELLALLKQQEITLLADVRTIPRSRTNPRFNTDVLGGFLSEHGIEYEHMPDLGGLRHPKPDSQNDVWENKSFRGYADYMETDKFHEAVQNLLELADQHTVAIMCSEAVWWRCHRSMVADELVARGIAVEHIMAENKTQPHKLRSFAHVENHHVSYH